MSPHAWLLPVRRTGLPGCEAAPFMGCLLLRAWAIYEFVASGNIVTSDDLVHCASA
jgi:hypothetical protein